MFPYLSLGCLILRKRHTNNPPPPYTHQPTMEQKLHRAWQQMKLKQNKSKTNCGSERKYVYWKFKTFELLNTS